jgi:hypothetical protein
MGVRISIEVEWMLFCEEQAPEDGGQHRSKTTCGKSVARVRLNSRRLTPRSITRLKMTSPWLMMSRQ